MKLPSQSTPAERSPQPAAGSEKRQSSDICDAAAQVIRRRIACFLHSVADAHVETIAVKAADKTWAMTAPRNPSTKMNAGDATQIKIAVVIVIRATRSKAS